MFHVDVLSPPERGAFQPQKKYKQKNIMSNIKLRELAISLLDDDHGITDKSYRLLLNSLWVSGARENLDISDNIKSVEGRFYISSDHTLIA